MFALSGWAVDYGDPLSAGLSSPNETMRWQDPATPLRISQLGAPEDGAYRLCLPDEISVDIFPPGRIVVHPRAGLPQITIDHFLADQIFPRLVAHLGELVVHAGAVRVGDGAVMLVGVSGRGKSTLSASFDQAGFDLLGDDAMIVTPSADGASVRAVYPSLRLFPDSVDAVMQGAAIAGPMAHYSDKQRIDLAGASAASPATLPVRAIFVIAPPAEQSDIIVRPLAAMTCCMTLVESSFAMDPTDTTQARGRLAAASAVARTAPAFEIAYPRDYARLADVRHAILDQLAAAEI